MEEKQGVKPEEIYIDESTLPVEQKSKGLFNIKPTTYDNLVKIGKSLGLGIAGMVGLVTGIGMTSIVPVVGPIVGIPSLVAGVWGVTRAGMTAMNNLEPSLMFMSTKVGDELTISQDSRVSLASKINDYENEEKMAMMQLQALVGFSRYKENFRQGDSSYTIDENGTKVYDQKISTITHTINLSTLDALEKLGLIKIDERKTNFKYKGFEALRNLGYDGKSDRHTYLLFEMIGFRNKDGVKRAIKGMTTKDMKYKRRVSKQLKKYTFRLTDKAIDYEDLYAKFNGEIPYESEEEMFAIRRFKYVLSEKMGILGKKDINIGKDKFGRDIIDYEPKESFAQMMKRKFRARQETKGDFDEQLRRGVDQKAVEAVLDEHREGVRQDLVDDGKLNNSTKKGDTEPEIGGVKSKDDASVIE